MSNKSSTSGHDGELEFHYVKSSTYHSFHIDGVVASPNANGMAVLTFYNERLAIPRHVAVDLRDGIEGQGEEKTLDGKSGVIRTMEATMFASLPAAKELRDWLDQVITAIESGIMPAIQNEEEQRS